LFSQYAKNNLTAFKGGQCFAGQLRPLSRMIKHIFDS